MHYAARTVYNLRGIKKNVELFNRMRVSTSKATSANLPVQCWAEIQQLALIGSIRSLHFEACNALGASDGIIHDSISVEIVSLRAVANS